MSGERDPRYQRSYFEERSHRRHRRSPTLSLSPCGTLSTPREDQGTRVTARREDETVKEDQSNLTTRAVDRRTRRHKQAAREEEVARREREGKKPFYIIVDAEGKPYGSGKQAGLVKYGNWQ